jgi:hypothetical protein
MQAREEEQLRRQVRLEESHVERVPGLRDEGVQGAGRAIVTEVIRVAATTAAGHVAPGDPGAAARLGEELLTAFDTATRLSAAVAGEPAGAAGPAGPAGAAVPAVLAVPAVPAVPAVLVNGRFGLGLNGGRAAGRPSVEVVHGVAADAGPGQVRRGTGVVIWGSAADIRAGAGVLDAGVLLSWARKQAFGKLYARRPDAAAEAMRAARDLEVLLLLDPDLGGGLWVDVDPVTQTPAATLLIEMSLPGAAADQAGPAGLADQADQVGRGESFRVLRP